MTQRTVRLNQLVYRELNSILHTLFRDLASKISITEASVSPDLHDAYIYFSVVGDQNDVQTAIQFLKKKSKILRKKLFNRIQLKYSPRLNFRYDESIARGQNITRLLDNL